MTTPAPQPRRPPLIERAADVAGPCRACARLKKADDDGWEICGYCDTNPTALKGSP